MEDVFKTLKLPMHLKPAQDGKIDSTGLADAFRQMGVEPEQVFFRFISKARAEATLTEGSDRDSFSITHNDDFGSGTNYEAKAMAEHGVYDRSYTSYLNDGASLVKSGADYTLDPSHTAVAIYRKDPHIISINPYKYIKLGESPSSSGFHIFKKHPLNFLIGVISSDGNIPSGANRPITAAKQAKGRTPPTV